MVRDSIDAIRQASPPGIVRLTTARLTESSFGLRHKAMAWSAARCERTPAAVNVNDLQSEAQQLAGTTSIESQELVTGEDAYYFAFGMPT